jgi:hypothetical protein
MVEGGLFTMSKSPALHESVSILLRELADGASPASCWILNADDPGLLRSLDKLSAAAASAPAPAGGASIAAHVDHLRYGFSLLNRWAAGENPFTEADYSTSWSRGTVSEEEWTARRAGLRIEIASFQRYIAEPRELEGLELTGVLASVAHLAYHVGATRQIDRSLQGPRARPAQ